MFRSVEAFRIQLVDVFGTRWPRGEPPVRGDDLEATDRRAVTRRIHEHLLNGISRKLRSVDVGRREPEQRRLLLLRGRGIGALKRRCAEFPGELPVELRGIAPGARGDLRGEKVEDDAILVRRPHRSVLPTAASVRHCGRWPKRYAIAAAR